MGASLARNPPPLRLQTGKGRSATASFAGRWMHRFSHDRLVFTLVLAALVLFCRRPETFLQPALWAEDGLPFFEQAHRYGAESLDLPYAGYHHFLLRLIAFTWAEWDPLHVPALFGYTTIAVTLTVLALLFSPRLAVPHKALLALCVVAVPHSGEVFGNLTNLQWITALGLLLVLLKRDALQRHETAGDAGLALLLGLTGPFSVVFLPLFVLRAMKLRTGYSVFLASVVGLAAFVQARGLLSTPAIPAGEPVAGWEAGLIFAYRSAGVLLLGPAIGERLGLVAGGAVGVALMSTLAWLCWRDREQRWPCGLLGGAFMLLLLSVWAKFRPDPGMLFSLSNGDRYFFVPKVLVLWLAVLAFRGRPWLLGALLVLVVASNYTQLRFPGYANPEWPTYAARMRAGENLRVAIAPEGMTFMHEGSPRPLWKQGPVRMSHMVPPAVGGLLAGVLAWAALRQFRAGGKSWLAGVRGIGVLFWCVTAALSWMVGDLTIRTVVLLITGLSAACCVRVPWVRYDSRPGSLA